MGAVPPSKVLITSARVLPGPAHDTIRIFNRGGLAGEITVTAGDGRDIASRLLNDEDFTRCEQCASWFECIDLAWDAEGVPLCADCLKGEAEAVTP